MRTRFDHFTDEQIEQALSVRTPVKQYEEIDQADDLARIAHLCAEMHRWQAWIGWPVTYYENEGLTFDGHHRVRATKFLARRRNLIILVPVRYSRDHNECVA